MNIGIDIDNVISNFDDILLKEFLKHDKELRNRGIINPNAYITKGMFDWNKDELDNFYSQNIEKIVQNLKVIKGAKKYINKLKKDGHIIYIITGRDNGEYTRPYEMTEKWLNKNKIYYDKLILTNSRESNSKTIKCQENNIDIMIEDSLRISENLVNNNIRTLIMDTPYNKNSKIERVYNWQDIYKAISNLNKKIDVIIDTDTANECDDQFALTYLLKSQNKFNLKAVTIAPYHHQYTNESISEGVNKSYDEVLKIGKLLNIALFDKVFKGATNYITNGYNASNVAVQNIITIALNNKKTYIIAIGAITNIALAILKEPKIISKIEIVWLGGNDLKHADNLESNFKRDLEAVKIILKSKVKLTIIPTKDVASKLTISLKELKRNLSNNKINRYLIDKFYNDGYHGTKENRVIWDIAAVAYLINKNWFKSRIISCPLINEDSSYKFTTNKHKITIIEDLNAKEIYQDLFKKLK